VNSTTLPSVRKAKVAIIVLSLLLAPLAAFAQKPAAQPDTSKRAALYELQDAFTSLVNEALPSVVSITSKRTVEVGQMPQLPDDPFFRQFPFQIPRQGTPQKQQQSSYGSGVIVKSDGYILTNDHVVGGADKVTVHLKDGREFEGTVSRDPRGDLALVKIDAKGLPAIKLGDSSKVKPGQWAIAIGSPFGLDQTVTVGVVSATGRNRRIADEGIERYYSNLIQTDASINPGNSGGPLINIDGELIGINTLIESTIGAGNIGIGFSIPVNAAKFALDQLISSGKVTRGQLGVGIDNLNPTEADLYGTDKGALVKSIDVGKAADKAGVQVEDVIVEFDGKPISGADDLVEAVTGTAPGKQTTIIVIRDKARKTLKVAVGEAPGLADVENAKQSGDKLGFSVSNITPELSDKYKLADNATGVVVTEVAPGGTAMQSGIRPGQVITKVNNTPLKSVADFNEITKDLKSGDSIRLVVQDEKTRLLIQYDLD